MAAPEPNTTSWRCYKLVRHLKCDIWQQSCERKWGERGSTSGAIRPSFAERKGPGPRATLTLECLVERSAIHARR
jgi:hypothetical protein